jgi:hypothetical protein
MIYSLTFFKDNIADRFNTPPFLSLRYVYLGTLSKTYIQGNNTLQLVLAD